MDAIEMLIKQHREMEALLAKVLEEPTDGRARRFAEAADYLTTHILAEERVFYPAIRAFRTEDTLLESLEEHLSLKRLLADLLRISPDDARFEAKFKVLHEQAEHHHEEEEEHLFPRVPRLIDEARRAELGQEMETVMRELRRGEPRKIVLGQTASAARLE